MNRLLKLLQPIKNGFAKKPARDVDKDNGYGLGEAIERVIDGTDSKLRLVPSYRRKIHDEVQSSLNHISRLVDQVPGPIDVSRKTFVSDPEVRAYFATPDSLQAIFSCGTSLKSFFDEHQQNDKCYALLCANKEEKHLTGSAIVADMLQQDVLQTAITFSDYKLLSPAENEYEVRQGIKKCIFDGLITYALQHIAKFKIERRDLHNQQRILYAQLRTRQQQGGGLSAMLVQAHMLQSDSSALTEELGQAEKKLETMLGKQDVLGFYLDEIKRIFANPETFIHLNVACFRLNDMGIMVSEAEPHSANLICFSELHISQVLQRVVAIISYSRDEIDCK